MSEIELEHSIRQLYCKNRRQSCNIVYNRKLIHSRPDDTKQADRSNSPHRAENLQSWYRPISRIFRLHSHL